MVSAILFPSSQGSCDRLTRQVELPAKLPKIDPLGLCGSLSDLLFQLIWNDGGGLPPPWALPQGIDCEYQAPSVENG